MPRPAEITIRDLHPADALTATEVLADAFVGFPALQVMVGTDGGARERLKRMFALEFEADAHATAIVSEVDGRLAGVLTYVDWPRCSHMGAGRMFRVMRIAGPRIIAAMRVFGRIERAHPRAPHRHLPSIGVLPEFQSRGVGRRLMEVFGQRCDDDAVAAYLETIRWTDPARPSHERFYTRLGYAVSDVVTMTGDWDVLTMTRSPRPGRAPHEGTTDEGTAAEC